MAIELEGGISIPILYEDRSVLIIDKPRGWMIVPDAWRQTRWNLQVALVSSISSGAYWSKSRNLKFLRYVHRLDAETTGILLFAKSPGAVSTFGEMFEERGVEKSYLAVVQGKVEKNEWVCHAPIAPVEGKPGVMQISVKLGKPAETIFRLLAQSHPGSAPISPVEASPVTGRTHQIRLHLAHSGNPVVGDPIYGAAPAGTSSKPMALRSVWLSYLDPFTRRRIRVSAPWKEFLKEFGFGWTAAEGANVSSGFSQFMNKIGGIRPPPGKRSEGQSDERKHSA
jgi:RluA family pseudouridine synthase